MHAAHSVCVCVYFFSLRAVWSFYLWAISISFNSHLFILWLSSARPLSSLYWEIILLDRNNTNQNGNERNKKLTKCAVCTTILDFFAKVIGFVFLLFESFSYGRTQKHSLSLPLYVSTSAIAISIGWPKWKEPYKRYETETRKRMKHLTKIISHREAQNIYQTMSLKSNNIHQIIAMWHRFPFRND